MNKGIPLIKKYEGLRLQAYICPAGLPTIGYGNTFYENGSKVVMGEKISIERADQLLFHTVQKFEIGLRKLLTKELNENQIGALTSFVFNVGLGRPKSKTMPASGFQASTLLRKVNANPNDPTIRAEFMRWTRANGKVLNGLVRRRQEEADLYFLM